MPSPGRLLAALRQAPLPPGSPAPRYSLTTDDGTWMRLQDHVGVRHIVLLFCKELDAAAAEWLRGFEAITDRVEELDGRIVATHHNPTPKLRAFKEAHQLTVPIGYDPLALEARSWRFASRLMPLGRTGAAVVAKDGTVVFHERGAVAPERVLAELASLEGVREEAAETEAAQGPPPVQHIGSKRAMELIEGDGAFQLVDVRTGSEFEADHAPMAVHIPVDELPQRYGELGQTDKLLFVCQAGGRSTAAAEFLASIGGTDIYNVVGGMSAWSGPRVTGGAAQ